MHRSPLHRQRSGVGLTIAGVALASALVSFATAPHRALGAGADGRNAKAGGGVIIWSGTSPSGEADSALGRISLDGSARTYPLFDQGGELAAYKGHVYIRNI